MEALIYKITSPTNRIYIGQTINYKVRIQHYKRIDCKNQVKLYNSLNKYGYNSHKFEIIHKCKESELNDMERYYQDLYSTTTRYGLNIRLTKSSDRSGKFSEEAKNKMSLAKMGKKRSPEVCKAISDRMKELAKTRDSSYYDNFKIANVGRKHTDEHKRKNSEAKKGNIFKKGKKLSDEQRDNIRRAKLGSTYRKNKDM